VAHATAGSGWPFRRAELRRGSRPFAAKCGLIATLEHNDGVTVPPFDAVSFVLSDSWAPDATLPTD